MRNPQASASNNNSNGIAAASSAGHLSIPQNQHATCSLFIRTIPSAPGSHRVCWPCCGSSCHRHRNKRSRAMRIARNYRRWGIAPRP